ncbi:MAG TPA: hypothetical protein VMP68_16165 [Candidatus Eisenbacteria bacterium]|nr:hypothetical protein [Candidatus Eisenbacteria bacterium]
MQFAKDSFFLALQARLAALNPARTVTINGATMPAIAVVENLPPAFATPRSNTFYIEWGSATVLAGGANNPPLASLNVVISYYSLGSVASMVDRGRLLGQLDTELLSICQPQHTEKMDYTQSPSADLGTMVFWTQPAFGEGKSASTSSARGRGVTDSAEPHQDARVERKAQLTIYFFSEVTLS